MKVEDLGEKIKSPIVSILSHWEDDVITQEGAISRAALLKNMESYPLLQNKWSLFALRHHRDVPQAHREVTGHNSKY